jgi:hypothetical protein
MCSKRLIVFVPKNYVSPPGEFLGFEKITQVGAYVVYCADNVDLQFYPAGWLYVEDETGQRVDSNPGVIKIVEEAEDTGIVPGGGSFSTGWNPWGLININLPWWLWLAVAAFATKMVKLIMVLLFI